MTPGTQLGHYEILSAIGKGGMGEVWKAKDTKLGREVAIKTLPEEFAKDADRLARFEREAKLLASLNHPNIAAIYGLEKHEGKRFLVLELVEGPTLEDRIKPGAIPVEESLKLALQIAEALEAAHEKGVIHRDLKPANIKVTDEGKVKVLDFGLAKAFAGEEAEANISQSPTLSMAATQQGIILGTAAYMSPEQAKGRTVDKRTDVWAFGAVLYEMLTGRQSFGTSDVSEALAAVIRADPEWNALPKNLHPRLKEVLERCLQKDVNRRFRDIGDVKVDIENVLADPTGVIVQPVADVAGAKPQSNLLWVGAFLLGGAVASVIFWTLIEPQPVQSVRRFPLTMPATHTLQLAAGDTVTVSPDGEALVYRGIEDGVSRLYRRDLDQLDTVPIPGTEGAGAELFFSPDSEWLAFTINTTTLMKIPLAGGRPVQLGELPINPSGGTWTVDDMIIMGVRHLGLVGIPGNGGEPMTLATPDDARSWSAPQVLPGGEAVLLTAHLPGAADGDLMLLDLGSNDMKTLIEDVQGGKYLFTGHLIFVRGGNVWATGFDLERLEAIGNTALIEQGILVPRAGEIELAVATDGTLAYIPRREASNTDLGLVDRNGTVELLNIPPNQYLSPRIDPDETRIAVQTTNSDGSDIWVYELSGDSQIRQLTQGGTNIRPLWSPDGERLAFASNRDGAQGIFWQPADGSGVAERLTTAEEGRTEHWPESWSPDGRTLSFSATDASGNRSIWMLSLDDGGEIELFHIGEPAAFDSQFSPDGNWVSYWAPNSGTNEVYVQPFPAVPGVEHKITQNTGAMALWSPDATELFYRPSPVGTSVLKSVGITTEPNFRFTTERSLPISGFSLASFYRNYDIMPDGQRFLMVFPANQSDSGEAAPQQINIVLNWFEELKQRVPVP